MGLAWCSFTWAPATAKFSVRHASEITMEVYNTMHAGAWAKRRAHRAVVAAALAAAAVAPPLRRFRAAKQATLPINLLPS